MKRNCFIILVAIVCSLQTLQAQVWSALGMGPGVGGVSGLTVVPGIYNGNFVAGGSIEPGLVEWNGSSSWFPIGSGLMGSSYVSAIAQYGNNLYVAGQIDSLPNTNGQSLLAIWNGASWSAINVQGNTAAINCLFVFDSILYVGGSFDSIGGIAASSIAAWNGTTWSALSVGTDSNGFINALGVYNGQVVAAGAFDSIGGVSANSIALWSGTSWSALSNDTLGTITVNAVTSNGKDLYVTGYRDTAGILDTSSQEYSQYMAVWNGTAWTDMGISVQVLALATYNGNIIAGGVFDSIGGITANYIAQYNGTSWSGIGGGIDSVQPDTFDYVGSLLVYDGNLLVGGIFKYADTVWANNFAIWGSPTAGINSVPQNIAISLYPNPGTGQFNITLQNISELPVLDVYNVLGEKVYQSILSTVTTEIDIGSQPAGIYLYRISKHDGTIISTGKYILE